MAWLPGRDVRMSLVTWMVGLTAVPNEPQQEHPIVRVSHNVSVEFDDPSLGNGLKLAQLDSVVVAPDSQSVPTTEGFSPAASLHGE